MYGTKLSAVKVQIVPAAVHHLRSGAEKEYQYDIESPFSTGVAQAGHLKTKGVFDPGIKTADRTKIGALKFKC